VKSGDALTPPEMYTLLDDLASTTMPFVCPHGRPVLLRIPTEELDRRFGRL
jgi:DNA mismatch repair protein MutL